MRKLLPTYQEIKAIDAAISLLNWDRQLLMPPGGAESRTRTLTALTKIRHEKFNSAQLRQEAEELAATAEDITEARMAAVLIEDIDREAKIPVELAQRHARVSSVAYDTWRQARAESNFALIAPHYRELILIAQELADAVAISDHPYDSLLDGYEPGATVDDIDRMFAAIKQPLIALRAEQLDHASSHSGPASVPHDPERLRRVAEAIATHIGFQFNRGRLDIGANAFCSSTVATDVRMVARPNAHVRGVLSSALHEMGHGLYEQNIDPGLAHTPLHGGVSLAIHESQSRLWENLVGRHPAFWREFYPELCREIPDFSGMTPDQFTQEYAGVSRSPIRVGSDELSYNLHILVRYELEIAMLTGKLEMDDLPAAWNERYQKYLGITPANDGEGVLQDVHWCRGSFGYFPTYAMGNIIGGQLWDKMTEDIDLNSLIGAKNFAPILAWLTEHVYRHGRTLSSRDLITGICGDYLDPQPWLAYVTDRFRNGYAQTRTLELQAA